MECNRAESCYISLLTAARSHTHTHTPTNIHMNLTEFRTVNYAICNFNGTTQTIWQSHACGQQLDSRAVQTNSTKYNDIFKHKS